MKENGLSKAAEVAGGRGNADDGFEAIPETPMGPPEDVGNMPEMDAATGLPLISAENTPKPFPGETEEDGQAGDILDFLFG